MTVTPDREKIVDFSDEYLPVQQHLIIHRGNGEISKLEDLNGQTAHVRNNTSYQERLLELIEEGLEVRLVLHSNVPTEELIRQVAEKEIEIQQTNKTEIQGFEFKLEKIRARYVKILVINTGICPEWHKGAGSKAWMFVDEINVE